MTNGYLVLTLKDLDSLYFTLEDGRKIKLLLVKGQRGRARLGIDAPRTIKVTREKVLTKERDG